MEIWGMLQEKILASFVGPILNALRGFVSCVWYCFRTREKMDQVKKRLDECEKEKRALKEKFTIRENLIVEHGVYFLKKGDQKDGPFCTRCWDTDPHDLVRLTVYRNGIAICPNCKHPFDYLQASHDNGIEHERGENLVPTMPNDLKKRYSDGDR